MIAAILEIAVSEACSICLPPRMQLIQFTCSNVYGSVCLKFAFSASCSSKPANTAKGEKGSDKPGKDLELKLSFQEGIAPGESLNEKLDFMEKLGVVGFEPGGGGLASRVNEIKQALNGRNIKVSAICAGFKGFILSTDPAIRKECMDTMKEIIAAAGELGSTGVIIVPAFNGQVPALPHTMETRDFLCEQFNEMGTFVRCSEVICNPSIVRAGSFPSFLLNDMQ